MMADLRKQIGKPLAELLHGIVKISAEENRSILGIALDSRTLQPGDLFLAMAGTQQHGLSFLDAVVQQGAVAVLYDGGSEFQADYITKLRRKYSIPLVFVPDLKICAGEIASRFWNHPSRSLRVVGITGTNGKTSTSHFIAQALKSMEVEAAVIGTLGMGVPGKLVSIGHTTPDAVRSQQFFAQVVEQKIPWVAMEVSSHSLDQYRVAGTHFAYGVWTNLSQDHLDYHGDLASYARAKYRLFLDFPLEAAILNFDDACARNLIPQVTAPLVLYGMDVRLEVTAMEYGGSFLQATQVRLAESGISFDLHSSWGNAVVNSQLLGSFNAHNLLATLAVLLKEGFSLKQAVLAAEKVTPVPGRMEMVRAPNKPTGLVDYAHTPDALEKALMSLRPHLTGKLWCVFGCGGDRDRGKRPLMGKIAEGLADRVVLTNDNPRSEDPQAIMQEILAGMQQPSEVEVIADRKAAILFALNKAAVQDWILIAGKGHEDTQIIGNKIFPFNDLALLKDWMEERL